MKKILFSFIVAFFLPLHHSNAQIPHRFDVVIDEIFADPTPSVSLPNAEFIELKNTCNRTIDLQGSRLVSTNARSAAFPSVILAADSFLIICSTSNSPLFTPFGKVLGIASFPSLANSGTSLSLISKEGAAIHSVTYNNSWFQNDVKSSGGWSLEMIDTKNPCTGFNNWKASTDPRGGTPGIKNSVDAINPDHTSPALLRAASIDSLTLDLTFGESLDSLAGATVSNYIISEGIGGPKYAVMMPPDFIKTRLTLSTPIKTNMVYTVTATNITDCSGNIIQAINTARVGLPSPIDSFDIAINEILFNPKPNAVDYIEVYNRSNKVLNFKDLYMANRSLTTNVISNLNPVNTENILFFPGDYVVFSENSAIVKAQYAAKNPANVIDVTMPSMPDDEGALVLLNAQGKVVDELHYSYKWHFALIDNDEGISLERIDYNKPTQNKDNWTSAASTVGFGTPTYQNSQFRADLLVAGDVVVTPKTFSPDNDGYDDFTTINIKMPDASYVANITIFDASGRPVKALAKNATLAAGSSFRWDGLDDKLHKVPVGIYVIYTEVFNLNGKRKSFKNTTAVATRL